MPSNSLQRWHKIAAPELDQIVEVHRTVGGTGRGRRYATEQINRAYAMLLSSQFQGFCRDLHSECVQQIVQTTSLPLQNIFRGEFQDRRRLDRGNPTADNIAADFDRLGLVKIWDKVKTLDRRNEARRVQLGELNKWRNAIAHQDFGPLQLGGRTTLRLQQVHGWRRACDKLAEGFDRVTGTYLQTLLGSPPW